MAASNFVVHISGNPNITTLASINVRAKPGTGTGVTVLFQAPIGTDSLPILDVQPDQNGNAFNGKVYQWFQVRFQNGAVGWVRDDLVSVEGDGSSFGYPNATTPLYGFSLMRQMLPAAPTPAPIPTPPAPTPTPSPTPAPIPAPPSGDVTGTVISKEGLNLRDTPINGTIRARLPYHGQVKVLGAQPQTGTAYLWAKVQASQGSGWVRTDFLSISGDGSGFGLSKGDEYPAPLQNYWYIRGQNDVQSNGSVDHHLGWDFSANPGEAIRCGSNGGFVMKVYTCTRCTADKPNVLSQGIPINDPGVLSDPAWGYGYGNAVQVRYTNNLLPASTRDRLVKAGMSGAHLFVIYGHMSAVNVSLQQTLGAFQQIGVIGNTGNSTALHVHVEIHASMNANDSNFGAMREFDPEILYLR